VKYLIVIAVVLLVLWSVRGNRRGNGAQAGAAKPGNPALPQDMVQCPICSVHLPRSEALPGPGGQLYCCAEHRQRAGS
jgi:uncharacterized protein